MSYDMLGGAVGDEVLGLLKDLLTKMLGRDKKRWISELKLFLKKQPTWVKVMKAAALPAWLKKAGSFALPAVGEFSAAVLFGDGFWTGNNFKASFSNYTKTGSPAEKFRTSELKEHKTGQEVFDAIGAGSAATGLEYVDSAIKSGNLKKDGTVYIFFAQPQIEGEEVRAVFCYWLSANSKWYLEAYPLSKYWYPGYQIVSRVPS